MFKLKKTILKQSFNWHKKLGIFGGIALLIFAFSAITHPLMSWTGPKQAAYFPPQTKINAAELTAISYILAQHNIKQAHAIKIVPSINGAILQVTQHNDKPRRYFDLATYSEYQNYDEKHAIWLARYYTGAKNTKIESAILQTEFDNNYPPVNRLLPVYRVSFDRKDQLTAFIYTEINALASLTNNWKNNLQSIFRLLHTWSWLNKFEYARLFVIILLLSCLFGLIITSINLIFILKKRKNIERKRLFHRIIAYVIWLPLLGFSLSGFYHLLHYAFIDQEQGLTLTETINFDAQKFSNNINIDHYKHLSLNSVSIILGENDEIIYRLALPSGKQGDNISLNKKYDGMATEKSAIYINAQNGNQIELYDRNMAIFYASKYSGLAIDKIKTAKLIKNFDQDYDFRNKRLPVWRIDYNNKAGNKLFIDPVTGILVDNVTNSESYESYSFSFLHKWNFMTSLIGRKARDILVVFILLTAIFGSILGFIMLLKKK